MYDKQGCGRQRGYALLVVIVVALTGLAVERAVSHLAAARAAPPATTARVLAEARLALLGYAASYPDRVNARFGPGYLPCPARDARGIAGPACAAHSGTTRGRFPWHTLRTNDLRDGAGESLWYVLHEAYRNNPKTLPLNNTLDAAMEVDGERVVAAVIAPGPALAGQRARRTRPHDPAQFLEGLNAVGGLPRLGAGGSATYNDRVVTITLAEWRAAVETRVLGEVARRLRDYAGAHADRLPWLAPWGAPGTAGALVGRREGRLALHHVRAGSAVTAAPTYAADIALSWELDDAVVALDTDDGLLPPACLRVAPCTVDGTPLPVAGPAHCTWWTPHAGHAPREVARCRFERVVSRGTRTFHYRADFSVLDDDGDIEPRGPSRDALRTRRVSVSDVAALMRWPAARLRIALRVGADDGREDGVVLEASAGSRGRFAVAGLRYALDVNAGELPAWLVENGWRDQIYAAWAAADCRAHAACLAVRGRRAATSASWLREDVRALLVLAGAPLPGAAPRAAGAAIGAWYEDDNRRQAGAATPFVSAPADRQFNDRLRIVGGAP